MHTHTTVAYDVREVTYLSRETANRVDSQPQDNSAFIREAVRQELERRGDQEDENNE